MKKMKQSVKARILSILAVVLVIICAICSIVVALCNSMMETALEEKYDLYVYSEDLRNASEYLTEQAKAYSVTGDEEHYENYVYEVETAQNREKSVAEMEAIGLTEAESAIIDEIFSISDSMIPYEEEAFTYVKSDEKDKAYEILYGLEYSEKAEKVSSLVDDFDSDVQERMGKKVKELQVYSNMMDVITYVALAITLIVQLIVMSFVLKELIAPILKIEKKMQQFSEGDIHEPLNMKVDNTEIGKTVQAINDFQGFQMDIIDDINYLLTRMSEGDFVLKTKCEDNYKGDYKDILLSVRKINRRLSATLSEINEASMQVDSGAAQVSSASVNLSQGATEQASSIQELSSTISVVSDMINNNAADAADALDKTTIAGDEMNNANRIMNDLVEAMNAISSSSNETKKIIKTIEDIAFQTNILALNAAVEAARAGSAGKGFAVVADEVRNLAGKSAEAAKNTTLLIEDTVSAIGKGDDIVQSVAQKMEVVSEVSSAVAEISNKIADASKDAAEKISQITVGVEQISTVVQTNSATAEETAAASEQLSAQADTCKQLISQFNLRKD